MLVDIFLTYQFIKKLNTPFRDWAAFKTGVIDDKGNVLVAPEKRNAEQTSSFGYYDVMILNLKKLLAKIPGGQTPAGTGIATLYLLKEPKPVSENMDELTFEELFLTFYEKHSIVEDAPAPANAAGGGAIAGIGVGPTGEPGILPKKQKKSILLLRKLSV